MTRLSLCLFLMACSSGTVQFGPDKSISFSRMMTEVYISVGPDGTVTYSSSPAEVLQGQLVQALIKALAARPNNPQDAQGDGYE